MRPGAPNILTWSAFALTAWHLFETLLLHTTIHESAIRKYVNTGIRLSPLANSAMGHGFSRHAPGICIGNNLLDALRQSGLQVSLAYATGWLPIDDRNTSKRDLMMSVNLAREEHNED